MKQIGASLGYALLVALTGLLMLGLPVLGFASGHSPEELKGGSVLQLDRRPTLDAFRARWGLAGQATLRRLAFAREFNRMKLVAERLESEPPKPGKAQNLFRWAMAGGLHPGRIQALSSLLAGGRFLETFIPEERTAVQAWVKSAATQAAVPAPPLNMPGTYLFHVRSTSVEREFELGEDGKTWRLLTEKPSQSQQVLQFHLRYFSVENQKWAMFQNAPLPLSAAPDGMYSGHQGDPQNGGAFTFLLDKGRPEIEVRWNRTSVAAPSSYEHLDFSPPPTGAPVKTGARMRTVETLFTSDPEHGAEFLAAFPQEPKKYH